MAVNSYREDEFMENTDKKKIMRRLFSYLLAYKGTIIAVLVCMGITVAISLVNPLLIEEAIDHYIAQSDLHGLIGLGIFALVLNLIFIVMVKLRMYAMAVISNKILLQIRQDLYEHIQTLSFSFFDSRPTGKILARIIGDVNSLKDVLVNVVTTMVPEFVTVVGVVVIMLVKDWRLALASLSTIPLMIAGIWFVQTASHKRWQIFRKKASNLNAYVHEDIAGMNVVQSFAALEKVNGIVVHYTANPGTTAQQNRDYFEGLAQSGETHASSHFVIGISGEIIQCIPCNEIAYASNDRNSDTVSIECCIPDDTGKFTDATYGSLVHLVTWLMGRYDLTTDDVIRHYDVTGKACPKYYVENEAAWEQFKSDLVDYIETNGIAKTEEIQ